MPKRCCVVGCNNNSDRDKDVSFHNFPSRDKSPVRYNQWVKRINRASFTPNKYSTVCTIHFQDSDIELSSRYKNSLLGVKTATLLKKTAVPSIRLKGELYVSSKKRHSSVYARKKIVNEAFEESGCSVALDHCSVELDQNVETGCILETDVSIPKNEEERRYRAQEIQCEIGNECYRNIFNAEDDSMDDDNLLDSSFVLTDSSRRNSESDDNAEDVGVEENQSSFSETRKKTLAGKYLFIYWECLMQLFVFCSKCGSIVCGVKPTYKGPAVTVTTECVKGHTVVWQSQNNINKQSTLSIQLSAAMYICGLGYTLFKSFAETLGLCFVSHSAYYKIVKKFVTPTIRMTWLGEQTSHFETCIASDSDVWLAADGQFDSPGFSAKYVTYTAMDINNGKIVDFVVLQKGQVDGELEKPACEILLERLTKKLKVTLFVSDRHRGVRKLMRTKYPSITHEFDVWHLSKSLAKKLKAIGKHSNLILAWSQSIVNHLWWSSKTCDNNEEMLVEKFTSILHHITDVHKWEGNKFVNSCEHDDLSYTQRPRKWLQPNSHDHRLLCSVIHDKQFLDDVKHTKNYCHTGQLESFHSVALKYKPKRNHFSYDGMVARTILSILDFNNNIGRSKKGTKLKFSKPLKKWVSVNVYDSKIHKWRKDILERVILVVKGKLRLELENDPHCATSVPKCIAPVPRPNSQEMMHRFSRFANNV